MKTEREPPTWQKKLRPIFAEVARVNRSFEIWQRDFLDRWQRAAGSVTDEMPQSAQEAIFRPLVAERDRFFADASRAMDSIRQRHGDPPCNGAEFGYLLASQEGNAQPGWLFRLLHWLRFAKRVETTAAKDATGDLDAYAALTRTGEDWRRVIFSLGGLKPFKRDEVHRQLLEIISCYEKEALTGEELVDCFDTFCRCGVETHSEDNLRKQYARLKKDLRQM